MKQINRRGWLALLTGGLLLLALGPGLVVAATGAVSIIEEDELYKFNPQEITINPGDTVTWTNDSDAEHTVTADDESFDHEGIGEGDTASQTFDTAGDFAYHCEIHDYMTGIVHVLPATDMTSGGTSATESGVGLLPLLQLIAAALAFVVLSSLAVFAWRRQNA